jgi:hypothetical protein
MMFKLLRCTCLHCFHLKMDLTVLARFRQRLALLLQVTCVFTMSLHRIASCCGSVISLHHAF